MKPILLAGSLIVSMALISYSVGVISEQRRKKVDHPILFFLSLGLLLDISGTLCMIKGSANSPFTYHGIIGYTALLAMLMDNILLWKLRVSKGNHQAVPETIHKYSRTAYAWWVFAYISGFLMAMNR
jgi:uncharacterized repeat protein (TIGR03987 family)